MKQHVSLSRASCMLNRFDLELACLQGTRQIARPRIVAICKRLEVDYGMAMTGFDIRGGRSIPRFEGVVVCEEFADQVEQEWEEEQEYGLLLALCDQQVA